VKLDAAHRQRFADWEWRDEERMELEIINAIEREGLRGAKLGCCERYLPCCC
jgi:hypothetical protein